MEFQSYDIHLSLMSEHVKNNLYMWNPAILMLLSSYKCLLQTRIRNLRKGRNLCNFPQPSLFIPNAKLILKRDWVKLWWGFLHLLCFWILLSSVTSNSNEWLWSPKLHWHNSASHALVTRPLIWWATPWMWNFSKLYGLEIQTLTCIVLQIDG